MGFLDKLLSFADKKMDEYSSDYARGSERASRMTDEELRTSLRNARENGNSSIGKTRAMVDEYKRRNS